MILSVIEGIVLCFVLLLVCVINIQNGPVGGVHYYEEPVKRRVIELGLITKEQMNKIGMGVKKFRLNTSPKYIEKEWSKDKIGKKLYDKYLNSSSNSFQDGF